MTTSGALAVVTTTRYTGLLLVICAVAIGVLAAHRPLVALARRLGDAAPAGARRAGSRVSALGGRLLALVDGPGSADTGASRWTRPSGFPRTVLTRRPLVTTAVIASIVGAAQMWWIWRYRTFGTLNADELRYMAGSLILRDSATELARPHMYLWYGPVLPALSAVALLVGPDDPRTVMSIQPVLGVLLAVCCAGIARRLAGNGPAVVAGVAVVMLPVVATATQSYLLVVGAAVAIAGAVWALLASEGGANRRIWLVGPVLALAPMSRAQSVVFVPAVLAGIVVACSATPERLRRGVVSGAVGVGLVALYFRTIGQDALAYIWSGLHDAYVPYSTRFDDRWAGLRDGMGRPVLTIGALLAVVGVVTALRAGERLRPLRGNPVVALTVVVGGGLGTLFISSNQGPYGFFDLPMLPLLAVLGATLIARSARPVRYVGGVVIVAYLVFLLSAVLWITSPREGPAADALGQYSTPFVQAANGVEPRMAVGRSDFREAADEWWDFDRELHRRMKRLDDRSPHGVELFYDGGLSNYSVYNEDLVAAMAGEPPLNYLGFDVISTPVSDYPDALVPADPSMQRVLVIPSIATASERAWPGDRRTWPDLDRMIHEPRRVAQLQLLGVALDHGWRIIDRIPMPLGDEMLIVVGPKT